METNKCLKVDKQATPRLGDYLIMDEFKKLLFPFFAPSYSYVLLRFQIPEFEFYHYFIF